MNNSPRQHKRHRQSKYAKSQFLTVFLPGLESCFLFRREGYGRSTFRFRSELPENNSAAEALGGLRLMLELTFRTLHGRGLYPRKIPLCPACHCVY